MSNDELNALQRGYYKREELEEFRVLPPEAITSQKRVALIECVEEIPCNPCAVVCRLDGIEKESLCSPPIVDWEKCTGCTLCVAVCPGLSIYEGQAHGQVRSSRRRRQHSDANLPGQGRCIPTMGGNRRDG